MKTRLDLLEDNFQPQILHKIIDCEIKINDLNLRCLMLTIDDSQREAMQKEIIELKKSLEFLNNVLDIIMRKIKEEKK